MEELQDELLKDLKLELVDELHKEVDAAILSSKIKTAIRSVKRRRNYQKHHNTQFINEDMQNYYDVVRSLAVYDWNMRGAEGQVSHSENGINRSWIERDKILATVVPFVDVF